jgi:26 proteasome complex subunit DSS1
MSEKTNTITTENVVSSSTIEKKVEEVPTVLELLEEDDEFEEFEGTTWKDVATESNTDDQLWQDDWDDDDMNDDFTQQLKAQIDAATKDAAEKP